MIRAFVDVAPAAGTLLVVLFGAPWLDSRIRAARARRMFTGNRRAS